MSRESIPEEEVFKLRYQGETEGSQTIILGKGWSVSYRENRVYKPPVALEGNNGGGQDKNAYPLKPDWELGQFFYPRFG